MTVELGEVNRRQERIERLIAQTLIEVESLRLYLGAAAITRGGEEDCTHARTVDMSTMGASTTTTLMCSDCGATLEFDTE